MGIGTRPISSAKVSTWSKTAGSVPEWPMTSPMLESHTPMAKCKARSFCGRATKRTNSLGARVEVLVVNTVRAGACLDASRQKDSLMARDSGTDSLIRSASRIAVGRSVVYVSRAKVSSICFRVAPRRPGNSRSSRATSWGAFWRTPDRHRLRGGGIDQVRVRRELTRGDRQTAPLPRRPHCARGCRQSPRPTTGHAAGSPWRTGGSGASSRPSTHPSAGTPLPRPRPGVRS
jgi:hypothetical protein